MARSNIEGAPVCAHGLVYTCTLYHAPPPPPPHTHKHTSVHIQHDAFLAPVWTLATIPTSRGKVR